MLHRETGDKLRRWEPDIRKLGQTNLLGLEYSLDGNSMRKALVRAWHQAGIKEAIKTHDMRTSWVTHARESGHALRDISRYVGHSSIKTTELYVKSGPDLDIPLDRLLVDASVVATTPSAKGKRKTPDRDQDQAKAEA